MTTSIYTRTQNFLSKSKIIHNDKYDYSLVEYVNNRTKVKIICPIHGMFEQRPDNHIHNECPKCAEIKRRKSKTSNTNTFIVKAKIKHNNKYDYSLVKYKNAKSNISIICLIHGIFKQSPDNHLHRYGCSKCANNSILTTEEFINKANVIHNTKYDYSLVDYKVNYLKVKIICSKHGSFEQSPRSHFNGSGCPICARENHNGYYNFKTLNRDVELANKDSTLYLIKHENLHKIGITTRKVFKRFTKSVKIISQLNNITLIKAHTKEQSILRKYYGCKEQPNNWNKGGINEFINITLEQRNQIIIDYFND